MIVRRSTLRTTFVGLAALLLVAAQPPATELPDLEGNQAAAQDQAELQKSKYWQHMRAGDLAEQAKRYQDAISSYTQALELKPKDPGARKARAHVLERRSEPADCPKAAIDDLALLEKYDPRALWRTERGVLFEWLGRCGEAYEEMRWDLGRKLVRLSIRAAGRPAHLRLARTQILLARAKRAREKQERDALVIEASRELKRYHGDCERLKNEPLVAAQVAKGFIDWMQGRLQSAQELLEAVEAEHPDLAIDEELSGIIADIKLQREVRDFPRQTPSIPELDGQLAKVRALLVAQDEATARKRLEELVAIYPSVSKVHKLLGQLYARHRPSFPLAIDAFKRAILLEPRDYEAHVLLGMLYFKEYPGEHLNARRELEDALELRPDLSELHLHLGRLYVADNPELARQHFQLFLSLAPDDHPGRSEASERLVSLDRGLRKDVSAFPLQPSARVDALPEEISNALARAHLIGQRHGEWEDVLHDLVALLERYPRETALLNAIAVAYQAQGDVKQALKYWRESLAVRESQMEVHERLAVLSSDQEEALRHLQRAAELGSRSARYMVASQLWQAYQLWEAADQLELYLREAGPYDLYWEPANDLRERMAQRFYRIYVAFATIGALFLILPCWWIWRRVRGITLEEFLRRSPKNYPDIARVLSLIRHEVLKHNTAFLGDVGQALVDNHVDAAERTHLLFRRLFGHAGVRPLPGTRRGVYHHFNEYCQALEEIARASRQRLNLEYKDPVFRQMIAGFRELAKYAPRLRNAHALGLRQRERLGRAVVAVAPKLGRPALSAIGETLQAICVMHVDRSVLAAIAGRVLAEDAFLGAPFEPVVYRGQGAYIRIFMSDFEAIFANVMRNSLASSLRYPDVARRFEVELACECDEITGLESLAIFIKDQSPEKLTNEMLRGRYIERGMGITADLLARYDGAIAVEARTAWSKAVVLRFFTVEAPPHGVAGELSL